jgi:hypothetical protein
VGEEGLVQKRPKSPIKSNFRELFDEWFPYYLSIGMTPEQYWDGDPWLCKAYRRKAEFDKERLNEQLWLQGMYIYEALADVAQLFNGMVTKPKLLPYPTEPYPLSGTASEERKRREYERKKEAVQNKLQAWMAASNRKVREEKRKEGNENAR